MNDLKPIDPLEMAHGLVKKHGAKPAYAITLRYPSDRYFQKVGRIISKHYPDELAASG